MSHFPTHDESDVLGATVGATGPTGTTVGATGVTGTGTVVGPTGPTGQTGAQSDQWTNYTYFASNSTRTDNTAISNLQKVQSFGSIALPGSTRIRNNNVGVSGEYECLETGVYRLSFIVPIGRASGTADRASFIRVTWGRFNTTSPLDDVFHQWYGGVIDNSGGESCCGVWVGTLTRGERYGLWQDTAGEGVVRFPGGQNSSINLEWVRAS